MAKQTITMLIDDLDEGEADETVRFGLDGVEYEIDLSEVHAEALRDVLRKYVAAGTKVGRRPAPGKAHPVLVTSGHQSTAAAQRAENKRIREWWVEAREVVKTLPPVKEKGRIPAEVTAAYYKYGGKLPEAPAEVDQAEAQKTAAVTFTEPTAEPTSPKARTRKRAVKPAEKPAQSTEKPSKAQSDPRLQAELREQIRAWAKLHGGKVGDKGRISREVRAAYDAQDPSLLPS